MNDCCETCRFFVEQDKCYGRCVRFPPTYMGATAQFVPFKLEAAMGNAEISWAFPMVARKEGWCGEYQANT